MNRLAKETSPYLLSHAHNPVDWYPWGPEALDASRSQNKPILLSVGYSACHWCHVMERECFENESIARLMNENFICIKVDREERPDLDQIYQNVAQLMTRSGGWPLTVFLTPDLRPFYGGTYFPPQDMHGRPGFPRLLQALSHAFKNEPDDVMENAIRLTSAIEKVETITTTQNHRPTRENLQLMKDAMLDSIDWKYGGISGAPKFFHTMTFTYLWRYGQLARDKRSCEATSFFLTRIAEGGIFDQLGGGFSRYSTDSQWLIPHFEKMLYDNALLIRLYSEVLLTDTHEYLDVHERSLYIGTLASTCNYVLREMTSPEGVFYSAQDADSEDTHGHKEEGAYFVWTRTQVQELLTADEFGVFSMRYPLPESGNFENGYIVLECASTVSEIAQKTSKPESEVQELLASAQSKLQKQRQSRAMPLLDDKTLVSWNALMISALTWAAEALGCSTAHQELSGKCRKAARTAYQELLDKCRSGQSSHELNSVYKNGSSKFPAYLDDYAYLSQAALDLARFNPKESEQYTADSRAFIQIIENQFADEAGGFYFTSTKHEQLIARPKTLYDQAIPAGTSVALQTMFALSELNADTGLYTRADEHLYRLLELALNSPLGSSELANTALLAVIGPVAISNKMDRVYSPFVFVKHSDARILCHKMTCQNVSEATDAHALLSSICRLPA